MSRPKIIITINVTNRDEAVRTNTWIRRASWSGDPGWLSLPAAEDRWAHCGDWSYETIRWVAFFGPARLDNDPTHVIDIDATAEVIDHLIDKHGFSDR